MESQVLKLDAEVAEFFKEDFTANDIGVIAGLGVAEQIIDQHKEIDSASPVALHVDDIDIITTSNAYSFVKEWPLLTLVGANKDIEDCFERAREQHEAIEQGSTAIL